MAYEALARKYRPQSFADMIGQDAVVKTLQNALSSGKIHPAYVFSGIRGVGKTTAARLFAKGLNCRADEVPRATPCGTCDSCKEISKARSVDVLEIDAATNTQVEKIRELTDQARYVPLRDRFRIYIIDEVHMLSPSSFNALLKTLEEPPPHAKFLLATTEPHKIPETILSRAQHFQFRRVSESRVAEFLQGVCMKEGLQAEASALDLIARSGEGSVRDSLTLLDRIVVYAEGAVTETAAVEALGVTGHAGLLALATMLANGDAMAIPAFVDSLLDRGMNLERFLSDFTGLVRRMLHIKLGASGDREAAGLIEAFSEEDLLRLWDLLLASGQRMRGAPEPEAILELQLIKAALLPRILPLDLLLSSASLPRPTASAPTTREEGAPKPAFPAKASRPEGDTLGHAHPEGLRFKAIIPFKRMNEEEARVYESAGDERVQRFRENAAKRLPLMVETLRGASLSVDPDGALHVALPPSDTTGYTLLSQRERHEALGAVARESGLSGTVIVEPAQGSVSLGSDAPPVRGPIVKPMDPAVDNVLKVFGGRVVKVTPPPTESPEGGNHAEPE